MRIEITKRTQLEATVPMAEVVSYLMQRLQVTGMATAKDLAEGVDVDIDEDYVTLRWSKGP